MWCCSSSFLSPSILLRPPHSIPKTLTLTLCPPRRSKPLAVSSSSSSIAISDPFVLEIAEKLEDSLASSSSSSSVQSFPPLQTLRESSSQSLLYTPWPTRKSDPFRFTDISYLRKYPILPTPTPTLPSSPLDSPFPNLLTLVNGVVVPSLSSLSALPTGVFVGSIADIPQGALYDRVVAALDYSNGIVEKDIFWDFNSVGAADIAVIHVPAGVRVVDEPIHVQFGYSGGGVGAEESVMPMSNPRVLVVVEEGAEAMIVEEHFGVEGSEEKCYWANSVMELVIEEGAKVSHSYIQRQSLKAAHIKWTIARQKSTSSYKLVEVSTGGKLSRHNLHIQQLGPDTVTDLSAFHFAQNKQIQDLHSKLILDHPRGYSRQLHKCIVCDPEGHAIFDGNIRVNRFAQKTDAGQQTRTLLLGPQALVHVKPNLQIVADDVKCAHGATVSDIQEDQLFYFRTRGLDLETAKNALVFSFGNEVINHIPFEPIKKKVISQVKELLSSQKLSAVG
ncbi:protein ABCI7, chloroplastic [Typha angustifolia]|uniref:protein ABCI7, chloroplastic n=1 Tax=Typha angustifolia TaxID=59011 RepID=UPI003C2F8C29